MSVVTRAAHCEDGRFHGDRVRGPSSSRPRRLHVIFVINLISSALILTLTCGSVVGVADAQQVVLAQQQQQPAPQRLPPPPPPPSPPQPTIAREPPLTKPLGSLQPDQEAYVFTSSFDTERDASELNFYGSVSRLCYNMLFLQGGFSSPAYVSSVRSWRKFK